MKQGTLRGFGAPYLSGALPPIDMPDDVVTGCKSEADAIRRSIEFAKRRFGYRQGDIAKLCGWSKGTHLSTYKKHADVRMPEKHRDRFCQVTGCNLLAQYISRRDAEAELSGAVTLNKRDAIAVARMLAVAA